MSSKRGLILMSGLAGAAALLALAIALRSGTPRAYAPSAPHRRASAEATRAEEVAAPAPAVAPTTLSAEPDVSRAMDLAGARGLLVTLMDAAAQGNQALQESALAGLRRYGTRIRPLVDERLAEAPHDRVREALDRARAAAR
ncbi:MAG TPA: hypothetical protein VF950_23515 [Planctomycetota bacterium]